MKPNIILKQGTIIQLSPKTGLVQDSHGNIYRFNQSICDSFHTLQIGDKVHFKLQITDKFAYNIINL